jgi:hypothetical protein
MHHRLDIDWGGILRNVIFCSFLLFCQTKGFFCYSRTGSSNFSLGRAGRMSFGGRLYYWDRNWRIYKKVSLVGGTDFERDNFIPLFYFLASK